MGGFHLEDWRHDHKIAHAETCRKVVTKWGAPQFPCIAVQSLHIKGKIKAKLSGYHMRDKNLVKLGCDEYGHRDSFDIP
jgi:hypothetical protein